MGDLIVGFVDDLTNSRRRPFVTRPTAGCGFETGTVGLFFRPPPRTLPLDCLRQVLRKFRKNSDVRQLFLFVRSELDGAKTKLFDVRTVRPPTSVRYSIGLAGGGIKSGARRCRFCLPYTAPLRFRWC